MTADGLLAFNFYTAVPGSRREHTWLFCQNALETCFNLECKEKTYGWASGSGISDYLVIHKNFCLLGVFLRYEKCLHV